MDESLQQWFTREILVHGRALVGFLTRAWPDRSEVDDLCHDTYVRVYEAAAKARPASPRGFLFATARHLMADRVRRGRIVSIEMKGDLDSLNVLVDHRSPEYRLNARQDLWRLAQAFSRLPAQYRDVVWMVKVEELAHKEIASRLGLTPKAVERRVARGIRLLEEAYLGGAEITGEQVVDSEVESEPEHG